jgi:hypothetical protein
MRKWTFHRNFYKIFVVNIVLEGQQILSGPDEIIKIRTRQKERSGHTRLYSRPKESRDYTGLRWNYIMHQKYVWSVYYAKSLR